MKREINEIIDSFCTEFCQEKRELISGPELLFKAHSLLTSISFFDGDITFDASRYEDNAIRQVLIDNALYLCCWGDFMAKIGFKKTTKLKLNNVFDEQAKCFITLIEYHYNKINK